MIYPVTSQKGFYLSRHPFCNTSLGQESNQLPQEVNLKGISLTDVTPKAVNQQHNFKIRIPEDSSIMILINTEIHMSNYSPPDWKVVFY